MTAPITIGTKRSERYGKRSGNGWRAVKKPPPPPPSVAADQNFVEFAHPVPLADHFINRHCRDEKGRLLLRRWRGEFFLFDGSCYRPWTDEAVDAAIYRHIEKLKTRKRKKESNSPITGEFQSIVPRSNVVREIRLALPSRNTLIEDAIETPLWLNGEKELNALELVACRNGLLHLPTGKVYPATPELFSVNATDFDCNPSCRNQPARWLKFLTELWGGDHETIAALREWFGYCLTPDTRQHKILLLVGPKRSGKGTIARVLASLLGQANVAGPTLASLGQNFGLSALLGKLLVVISDARLSGRSDQAMVVERLLSVSGEDNVTVDRKHRDAVTVRLTSRVLVLTNLLPRLADASGALASRFIVLTLGRSFFGREDQRLTDRLLTELPEILNWAVQGWRDLRARGHFVQPQASAQAIEDLENLGSPVAAFVREQCLTDPELSIECRKLFEKWKAWSEAQGHHSPGTVQAFARDLRAVLPGLQTTQPRVEERRIRVFHGIAYVGEPPI